MGVESCLWGVYGRRYFLFLMDRRPEPSIILVELSYLHDCARFVPPCWEAARLVLHSYFLADCEGA